jgi:hypothetical protein
MIKIINEPLSAESAEKFSYAVTWCVVTFFEIAALVTGVGMTVQGTYMRDDHKFYIGLLALIVFVLILNPGKRYAEKVSKS